MSLDNTVPTQNNPLGPTDIPGVSYLEEEQFGGGKRQPSPLPVLTPTRLRTAVKATTQDGGLVRSAQVCRGKLLEVAPRLEGAENDPFTACSEMPTPCRQDSILCASLLFDEDVSGGDVSFFARADEDVDKSQSPATTVVPTAIEVAGPLEEGPVVPTGSVLQPLSGPASMRGMSAKHDTVKSQAPNFGGSTSHPRSPYTICSSPIPNLPEPALLFSDEDTPRPASGTLPTISSAAGFDILSDKGTEWSELVPNDPPERPETPSPPERVTKRVRMASPPSRDGEQRAMVGRPSGLVIDILQEAFQKIDEQFHELSGKVGMPFHQVIARYTKQFARMNTANFWNVYQKYSMANKDIELARVPEVDVVNGTPSSRLACCYKLFRDEYPDTWHEILSAFEEVDAMEGHTVSHRATVFEKLAKNFKLSFAAMAKVHAIEGVFVMAGSVVNQDAGLGVVFTTPGAKDFFPDRCRADHNDILGHFKSHIYNKASLNHVTLAFEDAREDGPSMRRDVESPHRDIEEVKDDDQDEQEDHSHVRKALISALLKVGCQWAAGKLFPWKNMPGKLAKSGVICRNYPDNVPFPGDERQSRSKGGSKGISDLTLAECSTLIGALGDSSKDRLHFKLASPEIKGGLLQSRTPVIYGAAPAHDSANTHAKRMFADLTSDRKGVARKKNAGITCIKKKKEKVRPKEDVISISGSDDGGVQTARTKKSKNRPMVAGAIVDLTESVDRMDGGPRQTEVVITRPVRQAAKRRLVIDGEQEREDPNSPPGSDYQPEDAANSPLDAESDDDEGSIAVEESDVASRKCKRKKVASPCPSKKALGKRKAIDVIPISKKCVHVDLESFVNSSSDESDSQLTRPIIQSAVLPAASDPAAPLQKSANLVIVGQAFADVTSPPKYVSSTHAAPVTQEAPAVPSAAEPLPSAIAPVGRPRPKPRLVSKSNSARNMVEDGDDPFSLCHKKQKLDMAVPVHIADAGISQLQAAEEGRAGGSLVISGLESTTSPAHIAADDPLVQVPTLAPAATDIPITAPIAPPPAPAPAPAPPAPVLAPPSVPVVAPAPVTPATIPSNDAMVPMVDCASAVSERIVFPRLPPPFKNNAHVPPKEGEAVRPSGNEGTPSGFSDPMLAGGWYPAPPLHAYPGNYPPMPGPYAQWPSYAGLEHARARNTMAPAVHGMGGYPANLPGFDVANYYYHGQPAFMGAHPRHTSFMDGRAHPGMSHSSISPDVSAPSMSASEEGRGAHMNA